MAVGKTSLSAGEIIRSILISDSEVSARVRGTAVHSVQACATGANPG